MDIPFVAVTVYIFTALFGLCIGSYLNVVIYRIPLGISTVANPPSHCPNCNYILKWYDNIPVLSYLLLGRKCRNCKQSISPRYMIVELSNMLLWLGCVFFTIDKSPIYTVCAAIACSVLICIFFIDLEHMIIPDRFQVILLALGIAAIIGSISHPDGIMWYERLIGFAVGGGFFLLISVLFTAIRKQAGMGGGDIKLMAVAGLLLGIWNLLLTIVISSITASIVLLIVQGKNKERGKEYPFGPFIAFGIIISMFFGDTLINAYLNLLTL